EGKTLSISWEKLPQFPNAAQAAQNPGPAFAMLTILKVKPDKIDAFKAAVAKIVDPTLHEPNCIAWYVQQSQTDSTDFLFYTRWKDDASLQAHLNSDPLKQYLADTNGMLQNGFNQLVKYWPIDGELTTRGEL